MKIIRLNSPENVKISLRKSFSKFDYQQNISTASSNRRNSPTDFLDNSKFHRYDFLTFNELYAALKCLIEDCHFVELKESSEVEFCSPCECCTGCSG